VPAPVVEALRRAAPQKDYLPVRGLPELREAVADFHRRNDGVAAQAEDVLIGPGSKELMFLLQIVYYGEILITSPAWVSYLPQAQIIGRRVGRLHTTYDKDFKLDLDAFVASIDAVNDKLRPRLLVLNYPNNPTGASYTADELEALADVLRRYEIIVLSDEIYGLLEYDGAHVSIARYYPERTIISSGLSKWCGAGGWRLGTFVFPHDMRWLLDAMAAVASETYTSVSAPIQHASITAFRGGVEIDNYLRQVRRILATLGHRSAAILRDAGLSVVEPSGAFYVFPDFSPFRERLEQRGIRDGATLCRRMLDEIGVACLPASAFVRSRSELDARLAFVDFDGAAALAAAEKTPLDQPLPNGFLEERCGSVLRGMNRLAEWIGQQS